MAKQLFWYEQSYHEHGYKFTKITVFAGAIATPIARVLENCTVENYGDQERAQRARARYTMAQQDGISAIVESMDAGEVSFKWMHCTRNDGSPFFGRADLELSSDPFDIRKGYALWVRLKRRLLGLKVPYVYEDPQHVRAILKRARKIELYQPKGNGTYAEWITAA